MNTRELHEQLPERLKVDNPWDMDRAKSCVLEAIDKTNYVIMLSVLRDIVQEDVNSMKVDEQGDDPDAPSIITAREQLIDLLDHATVIMIDEVMVDHSN